MFNNTRAEKVGKFLKFQLNSYFESNGGLQYIGIFGESKGGFLSKFSRLWLHNCLLICNKDEACYDTTTNVYEPYTRKNSPDDVSKDHCDKLSYVTKEGEMFPLCDGDCSCCRPSVTQGTHVAKTL